MLNQRELISLNRGDAVEHFLLIKKAEIRLTKTSKQYLFLELGDQSLSLPANMWENFAEFSGSIKSGDVVRVSGSMDEFQGTPQIRINSIRKTKKTENISPQDFLPISKR
ncbi:MAG TPA: hydrolase, partial [Ignavibacteria bacterium]|nr:hydrolase [Ignavibacteria bacterium]